MLTREDLAKYPFLRKASSFIEGYGLTLKDLAAPEYSGIVKRAVERVRNSIEGKKISTDWKDPETEILAYPLALAFTYGLKADWVVRRFANAESKRCFELLKMEGGQKLMEVAENGFGWVLEPVDMNTEGKRFDFALGVTEYLEVAPQFHSANWKLVNRYLIRGRVHLKQSEVARLMSESVKNKIVKRSMEEEVRKFEVPEVFGAYLDEVTKLVERKREFYDEEAPRGLVEEAKPPCIMAIISELAAGKSLSHMARFTITTFMLNIGENIDNVLRLFNSVADFDEAKARYQIEHIAGRIGSRTKYAPPKCEVLKTFGLCIGADILCEKVRHPLRYYKIRAREISRVVVKTKGGGKAA
ncbi:MAG: DNA primase large subunit PriL [Candidatus Methanomethyliaceae archaeon]|nr:DNA primase large subunit PriL [Candidatus Methanomethyliaceae archaeon]